MNTINGKIPPMIGWSGSESWSFDVSMSRSWEQMREWSYGFEDNYAWPCSISWESENVMSVGITVYFVRAYYMFDNSAGPTEVDS